MVKIERMEREIWKRSWTYEGEGSGNFSLICQIFFSEINVILSLLTLSWWKSLSKKPIQKEGDEFRKEGDADLHGREIPTMGGAWSNVSYTVQNGWCGHRFLHCPAIILFFKGFTIFFRHLQTLSALGTTICSTCAETSYILYTVLFFFEILNFTNL